MTTELTDRKCVHGTPFGERCVQCRDCAHGYWHGIGCPECELEHHYTVRGNRTFTVSSCMDEGFPVRDAADAFAVAENIAAHWGESVTLLRDGTPIGTVLPDRGF